MTSDRPFLPRRSRALATALLAVLTVAPMVWAAGPAAAPWKAPARAAKKQNPFPADNASLQAGKRVYEAECSSCHGPKGKGDGPSAKDLEVPAGDLSNPALWGQSDGELFWKLTEGRKPMPSYAQTLTEEQRWHVVNFLRTLAKKPAS